MSGIFSGLQDVLGVGDFGNENSLRREALDAFKGIQTPDINLMRVRIQKLVQQGIVTPQEATAYLQNPTAYNDIKLDPAARDAQMEALNGLMGEYNSNGMSATDRAKLAEATDTANAENRGQQGAITQNFAERGQLGSGNELVAKLLASQGASTTAAKAATDVAGQAAQRALQAMMESGKLGGDINAADYKQASDKAAAADAIARFNADNSTKVNLVNTAAKNTAQASNLKEKQRVSDTNAENENTNAVRNSNLYQTDFNNKITKARGIAGQADTFADARAKQQQEDDAYTGGMMQKFMPALVPDDPNKKADAGPGFMQMAGDYMAMASKGGKIPGKAPFPGDSPFNDHVPALLSPGEVVVPRTVAKHPAKAKEFVKHAGTAQPVHPEDIESVIRALGNIRCYGGKI